MHEAIPTDLLDKCTITKRGSFSQFVRQNVPYLLNMPQISQSYFLIDDTFVWFTFFVLWLINLCGLFKTKSILIEKQ